MTKNPILNALTATLYITIVTIVINLGSRYAPKDDSVFAPIAFLSLFTFSAATMAYIFGKEPLLLWFDGKKKQAVTFFVQTLTAFGVITFIALILIFTGILK